MKNTVLKYKREKINGTYVRDYFSKDVDLSNIKEEFPNLAKYFKNARLMDNETPEQAANNTYSNPDLWDFMLLTNSRDPLFGLPYDYDVVKTAAQDKLKRFLEELPRINITESRKEELLEEFLEEADLQNEENRNIEAIEPKNLSQVISVLRQAGKL